MVDPSAHPMLVRNAVERSLSVSTGRCKCGREREVREQHHDPTRKTRTIAESVVMRCQQSGRAIVVASWSAKEMPWDRNFRTRRDGRRSRSTAGHASGCLSPQRHRVQALVASHSHHVARRSLRPSARPPPLEEAGVTLDQRIGEHGQHSASCTSGALALPSPIPAPGRRSTLRFHAQACGHRLPERSSLVHPQ